MITLRKTNRLNQYDYSQPGFYFVTICCDKKVEYFGEVQNGKMVLNELGRVAW